MNPPPRERAEPDSGSVQIIVPVRNEGDGVRRLHAALAGAGAAFDVLRFVYDSDDDSTLPHIRDLRAGDARVEALRNDTGPGVVNALRHAFARCQPGPVIVLMGDSSDDLSNLPAMVRAWRLGATIVCPSRHMPGGRLEGGPWLKRRLSRLAGRSLFRLGLPVSDPTNNHKLYDGAWLAGTRIESRRGFEVALELCYRALREGRVLVEMPSVWRERTAGRSRFRLLRWLPGYLRWYLRTAAHLIRRRFRPRAVPPP